MRPAIRTSYASAAAAAGLRLGDAARQLVDPQALCVAPVFRRLGGFSPEPVEDWDFGPGGVTPRVRFVVAKPVFAYRQHLAAPTTKRLEFIHLMLGLLERFVASNPTYRSTSRRPRSTVRWRAMSSARCNNTVRMGTATAPDAAPPTAAHDPWAALPLASHEAAAGTPPTA